METFFAQKDIYPLLAVMSVMLTVGIIFVSHYWYKLRRTEMELGLKQTMIDRGMTAEEICAVVESGPGGKPDPEMRLRAARCKAKFSNRF